MSRDLTAIVLPSGLGVRFRGLSPSQLDSVLANAAKDMTPDATYIELTLREQQMGLEAMIKEVTTGPCKKSSIKTMVKVKHKDASGAVTEVEEEKIIGMEFDVNHPDNKWQMFNPDAYEDFIEEGRDHSVLKSIYSDLHRTHPSEVAAIMGKAVPVAMK